MELNVHLDSSLKKTNTSSKVLDKLEEIEFYTSQGPGTRLHYEFFKNFDSDETRKAYYRDLTHFFKFFKMAYKNSLKNPKQVKRIHIIAYKDFLKECGGMDNNGASNLTIRRKMSCLSSYFKFMLENDVIDNNPVDGVRRPKKRAEKGTESLSENQVRLLLDHMDLQISYENSFKNHLHRTMIYILFYTGIRVSELINIKRSDFFTHRGHKALRIKAKGDKLRMIPIHHKLDRIIREYVRILKSTMKEKKLLITHDFLFFSLMNNKNSKRLNISRHGVYKILNQRCFQAGIRGRISPHSARATLITSLLDQGHDLYKVSQSVGHANTETTKIYDKRNKSVIDSALLDINY